MDKDKVVRVSDMDKVIKNIEFYENSIEYLRFIKSCKQQAKSYYKGIEDKNSYKKELIEYFFLMERGRCTNDMKSFFLNLYKQLETIAIASIEDLITLDKLKYDYTNKKVKNKDGIEESMNSKDNGIWLKLYESTGDVNLPSTPFASKMGIFYLYFIGGDFSDSNLRFKKMDYSITNNIAYIRNKYSHGGFKPKNSKEREGIRKIENDNKNNTYWSYVSCLKPLHTMISEYSDNLKVKDLKF